jgi:hypothetical protein
MPRDIEDEPKIAIVLPFGGWKRHGSMLIGIDVCNDESGASCGFNAFRLE